MRKFFGNKAFYKEIFTLCLPLMLHQLITNLVSLIDNVMVGRLSEEAISAVAITNQIMFVFNICTFGIIAGSGIFISQFLGAKDDKNITYTFRFKLWLVCAFAILGILILFFFGDSIIRIFLQNGNEEQIETTFLYAKSYLKIVMLGIFPFALTAAYSTTLRETFHAAIPMAASMLSIIVNVFFNYGLIFGHFGFSALGVEGAAIATVIARFVEMLVVILTTHILSKKIGFVKELYFGLYIPKKLIKNITLKSITLFVNEIFWSLGMSILLSIYVLRDSSYMASFSINSTITNLFYVVYGSLAIGTSIFIGKRLGANRLEEARSDVWKLIVFNIFACIICGIIFISIAGFIPSLYNITSETAALATKLMIVASLCLSIYAFNMTCYFVLRAGGVTIITFLFDSCFVWTISIPFAYILVSFSTLSIVLVYLFVQLAELIKVSIGYVLLRKGIWIKNIISEEEV